MFHALNLILTLRQQFNKLGKIGKVKQINIKNRTSYFYNDQINLKHFDARLLKLDTKDYNEIDIYYIGYVTVKFKKKRFESKDDLPINKRIRQHLLTIIIRFAFSEGDKFYPQLFLEDALYELV